MASMSHGTVLLQQVFCALCAVKLEQTTSRVNVLGRSSFPVEAEIRKLPLRFEIDEHTRICLPCVRKLKKRKALEENLAAVSEEIVRTFNSSVRSKEFVPRSVSTPTKERQPTTSNFSTPRTTTPPSFSSSFQTPTTTVQSKQIDPGVTVSWFVLLQ